MIVALHELADIRARHPGKQILLTSGTYDLLHVGHVRYLVSIKAADCVLVVMLSNDNRTSIRKGPARPVIPEADRAEMLDALSIVDYVFIDPSHLPPYHTDPIYAEVLARLRPDAYITYCEDGRFTAFMDKSKLVKVPRAKPYPSTTAIIEHIIDSAHQAASSSPSGAGEI